MARLRTVVRSLSCTSPVATNKGPSSLSLPHVARYIVDGNALFLTATESAWRRELSSRYTGGGLIVAIGYPLTGKLFDIERRNVDLTPPTKDPISGYGGADRFLDFIDGTVRPAVKARFPQLSVSREGLYGHSYGGLFALHALFTRPTMFDGYLVSSPSIWWNNKCIMEEAKNFLEKDKTLAKNDRLPSLAMFWGSFEQTPPRWDSESLDDYEKRAQSTSDMKMADNAFSLSEMLRSSQALRTVKTEEHYQEEHISVMPCSVSRSLIMFFEDWSVKKS